MAKVEFSELIHRAHNIFSWSLIVLYSALCNYDRMRANITSPHHFTVWGHTNCHTTSLHAAPCHVMWFSNSIKHPVFVQMTGNLYQRHYPSRVVPFDFYHLIVVLFCIGLSIGVTIAVGVLLYFQVCIFIIKDNFCFSGLSNCILLVLFWILWLLLLFVISHHGSMQYSMLCTVRT